MPFNPTSPITGAATNLHTNPTFTLTADTAPNPATGKQWAITTLGGTQTGVTTHGISDPFTVTMERPKQFRVLKPPNSVGVIAQIPYNRWVVCRVRKGVTPAANQSKQPMRCTANVEIPAGAESYDRAEVESCWSAFAGVLNQNSAAILTTLYTGVT